MVPCWRCRGLCGARTGPACSPPLGDTPGVHTQLRRSATMRNQPLPLPSLHQLHSRLCRDCLCRAVLCSDVHFTDLHALYTEHGAVSFGVCPMLLGGHVLGVITAASTTRGAFNGCVPGATRGRRGCRSRVQAGAQARCRMRDPASRRDMARHVGFEGSLGRREGWLSPTGCSEGGRKGAGMLGACGRHGFGPSGIEQPKGRLAASGAP